MGSACPPCGSVSRAARGRWFRLRPLLSVEEHEEFTRMSSRVICRKYWRAPGEQPSHFHRKCQKSEDQALYEFMRLYEFVFFDISNLCHWAENEL